MSEPRYLLGPNGRPVRLWGARDADVRRLVDEADWSEVSAPEWREADRAWRYGRESEPETDPAA